MMNRIISILAAAMFTIAAVATNLETALVVQITDDELNTLPEKTVELKLRKVKFKTETSIDLVPQLTTLFDSIAANDEYNYVFVVELAPAERDETALSIRSMDYIRDMDGNIEYYGAMKTPREHFLFVKTKSNEALLKSLLDREKEKISYIREYEVVEHKAEPKPSSLIAKWRHGRGIEITTYCMNGENELDYEHENK